MNVQLVYKDARWHLRNNLGEVLFGRAILLTWTTSAGAMDWMDKRYTNAYLEGKVQWVDMGATHIQGQPGRPSIRHQPGTAASYRPAHAGYPGDSMLKPAPTLGELLRDAIKRGPSEGAAEKRLNVRKMQAAPVEALYWPLVQWPFEQVSHMGTRTGRMRSTTTYGSLNDHNDEPMTVSVLGFLIS